MIVVVLEALSRPTSQAVTATATMTRAIAATAIPTAPPPLERAAGLVSAGHGGDPSRMCRCAASVGTTCCPAGQLRVSMQPIPGCAGCARAGSLRQTGRWRSGPRSQGALEMADAPNGIRSATREDLLTAMHSEAFAYASYMLYRGDRPRRGPQGGRRSLRDRRADRAPRALRPARRGGRAGRRRRRQPAVGDRGRVLRDRDHVPVVRRARRLRGRYRRRRRVHRGARATTWATSSRSARRCSTWLRSGPPAQRRWTSTKRLMTTTPSGCGGVVAAVVLEQALLLVRAELVVGVDSRRARRSPTSSTATWTRSSERLAPAAGTRARWWPRKPLDTSRNSGSPVALLTYTSTSFPTCCPSSDTTSSSCQS